jgi:hypothetical protein
MTKSLFDIILVGASLLVLALILTGGLVTKAPAGNLATDLGTAFAQAR